MREFHADLEAADASIREVRLTLDPEVQHRLADASELFETVGRAIRSRAWSRPALLIRRNADDRAA